MHADRSSSSFPAGIHEDDGSSPSQRLIGVRCNCNQCLVWHGAEVIGRVLDEFDITLAVSTVKPLLKGRPASLLRRSVKAATEAVETVLARAVWSMFASEKQNHNNISLSRQSPYPLVHKVVGNRLI